MADEPSKGRTRAANVDVLVGQRIREVRLARKVGQEDLGRAIGVTFQQVQKYERGTNRLAVSRLVQIATYLQHPVEEFVTGIIGDSSDDDRSAASAGGDVSDDIRALRRTKGPRRIRQTPA